MCHRYIKIKININENEKKGSRRGLNQGSICLQSCALPTGLTKFLYRQQFCTLYTYIYAFSWKYFSTK